MDKEIIVLAGGFGTRIAHLFPDTPKPMIPVGDKPFLIYIFEKIIQENFSKIVLSVGYEKEKIIRYFGASFNNVPIVYSTEDTPLGTGGAIKRATKFCSSSSVFITNGDSLIDLKTQSLLSIKKSNNASIVLTLTDVSDAGRFGKVNITDAGLITSMNSSTKGENNIINAGVYLISREVIDEYPKEIFSFENEFLKSEIIRGKVYGYMTNSNFFIDIGVPSDYKKFCNIVRNNFETL